MKLIIFIILTAYSFASSGSEFCSKVAEASEAVMEARQVGVKASTLIEHAGESKLNLMIIQDAYSQTLYSTEKYKKSAITEFSNKWLMLCLKEQQKTS
jgi:hypothetical protein